MTDFAPKYADITDTLSASSKASLKSAKCPTCDNATLILANKTMLVAKPVGTYSLAGMVPKASMTTGSFIVMKCNTPDCDFEKHPSKN